MLFFNSCSFSLRLTAFIIAYYFHFLKYKKSPRLH
nr:MAG TPA: hypothetical protein [Caudoviricetes sp.]